MEKKVISYLPSPNHKADTPNQSQSIDIAVVTEAQNDIPVTVTLNDRSLAVIGYFSLSMEVKPKIQLGDIVLIKLVQEGAWILGVGMSFDTPDRASFYMKDDNLYIEAKGSVVLKNEHATIELTKAGTILIDGENVRTVAEQTLTLLGGKVIVN